MALLASSFLFMTIFTSAFSCHQILQSIYEHSISVYSKVLILLSSQSNRNFSIEMLPILTAFVRMNLRGWWGGDSCKLYVLNFILILSLLCVIIELVLSKIYFYFICKGVFPACVSMYHTCVWPAQARKGYWVPWNWSYRQLSHHAGDEI